MTVIIGRRDLLAALGGAAAAWPRGEPPAKEYMSFFCGETMWTNSRLATWIELDTTTKA
jgi:hypothetical protein